MFRQAAARARRFLEQPVNRAFTALAALVAGHAEIREQDKPVLALIRAVMPEDGLALEEALERFAVILARKGVPEHEVKAITGFLRSCRAGTPEEALPVLRTYAPERRKALLKCLLLIGLEQDTRWPQIVAMVTACGRGLDYSAAELEELEHEARSERDSRERLLKSGTGIVLALIVIAVFVLVAHWLSPVLFGLALAYIFLPLERFFERKLQSPPSAASRLWRWCGRVFFPLTALRRRLMRRKTAERTAEEQRRHEQRVAVAQATTLTVSTVVVLAVVLFTVVLMAAGNYFAGMGSRVAGWISSRHTQENTVAQPAPPPSWAVDASHAAVAETRGAKVLEIKSVESPPPVAASTTHSGKSNAGGGTSLAGELGDELVRGLNLLQKRFQELPLISAIIQELARYLNDGRAQEELTKLLVQKSGGIFSFLASLIGALAAVLLDLFLTIFFFSLFLSKLANFGNDSANAGLGPSSYLIRTVFNGKWLPRISGRSLEDGDRIVTEVIAKLRIWLRGYLTLIVIDFCVYGICFHLLQVPYALILAAIAAVGILLPYLGPISSALLTVLVTLAAGGGTSSLQIAAILGVYLLHNGIIEQFFIYPWIIGESLGLTTLETIIVVLLGGILAGIPGMIFALPAAAVIKYLVPQIYRCWK